MSSEHWMSKVIGATMSKVTGVMIPIKPMICDEASDSSALLWYGRLEIWWGDNDAGSCTPRRFLPVACQDPDQLCVGPKHGEMKGMSPGLDFICHWTDHQRRTFFHVASLVRYAPCVIVPSQCLQLSIEFSIIHGFGVGSPAVGAVCLECRIN